MKLFGRISLAMLLASGLTVAVSLTATAGGAATGTTIHLIERDTVFSYLPLAGPRQSRIARPGDETVFTGTLLTPQKKPAGHTNVVCVATTGGDDPVLSCTGIFTLTGGTLVGTALVHGQTGPTSIAVVGGTGVYEGARGSVVSRPNRTNRNISYDTVHLLP